MALEDNQFGEDLRPCIYFAELRDRYLMETQRTQRHPRSKDTRKGRAADVHGNGDMAGRCDQRIVKQRQRSINGPFNTATSFIRRIKSQTISNELDYTILNNWAAPPKQGKGE